MSESDRILLEAEAAAAEAKAKHLRACLLDGGVTTATASPTVQRMKPARHHPVRASGNPVSEITAANAKRRLRALGIEKK